MNNIYKFSLFLISLLLINVVLRESAFARKVVCIDSASYRDNFFIPNHEGYERQNARPGDIIEVVSHLDSCLKKVMSGDTLVLITHGFKGGFTWGGENYDGFGNDTNAINPHPVPASFDTINNVFVKCCSCFSKYSDDTTRSVVQKITDALGGAGNGADGFPNSAWVDNCLASHGGTAAQRDSARAVIKRNTEWGKFPPPNRMPPVVPNQKTEAQRIIDSALGGRHVVIDSIYYLTPKDTVLAENPGSCGAGGSVMFVDGTPGGVMLIENFNYPPADSLGTYGWINFSGGIVNRYMVTPGNISFPGYPLSNIGNQTIINNTGQDDYKDLYYEAVSGSVYAYFLTVVINASVAGDYFAALLPSTSTTNYQGRVFVKNVGGLLSFGISKSTDPPVYGPPVFNMGQPLLVVLKYKFNTGTNTDDQISLFVYNNIMPPLEPLPYAGPTSGVVADLSNIQRFAIRQGNPVNAPVLAFDGLKVAQTWNTTVVNVELSLQGFYNASSNEMSQTDTFAVELRQAISPYPVMSVSSALVNKNTLKGSFEFLNTFPGMYYLVVKHRNGLETWSAGDGENYEPGGVYSYNFRSAQAQAFGSNQIQKGSTFCLYNGDVDHNGLIDLNDVLQTFNDANAFAAGYVVTDLTGDNIVDLNDVLQAFNNAAAFVGVISP